MGTQQDQLLESSVLKETKDKFDSFLKTALQQTQTSLETKPRISRTSLLVDNEPSVEENKEFILNKFFETSNPVHGVKEVKPVPKPRSKLRSNRNNPENATISPLSSNDTFRIGTPNVNPPQNIDIQTNVSSASSSNTYKVSSPKLLNIQDDDLSSQKTFRISKRSVPKIGDIVIHEKDSISKIVDVQIKNETESLNTNKSLGLENKKSMSGSEKMANIEDNANRRINSDIGDDLKSLSDMEKSNDINEVNEIVCITIHRTDRLLLNSFVIHPVVKIHIADIHTGNYYPKKNKERSVVYYYENNLDYIAPVMSRPYNLQEKRSLIPLWEEKILMNEEYEYIVEQKNNIIIFFEILDFASMPMISNKSKGWHKIAFAFLKISGKNDVLNLNKKMRLQLYYCSYKKEDNRMCSIWETWNRNKLVKYPSSIYVSISNSSVKGKISTGLRSSGPMEKETGKNADVPHENNDMEKNIIFPLKNTIRKNKEVRARTEKITRLPNVCLAQFETEKEGCFILRFNNSGSLLACGLKLNNIYCIVIYSVDSFEQICYLPGHQDLIHSIRWSPDDSFIIACSADCSVSIWDINKASFLQILPHPSFVYANDISSNSIITGSYDMKLRIWQNDSHTSKYLLKQELGGHNGYITSVLFKKSSDTILSSDSLGVIIKWYQQSNSWVLHKKITIFGLEGIVINQIEFIGKEKRLLVHSRDNILRIIDLDSSVVMHWLQGGLNTRFQTSCSVSSCGNYVIAGSENSCVNIWKVKSGKYIGRLLPYKDKGITIHALQFHPRDNMIAVGHFGNELPVLLFGYNGNSKERTIDLRLVEDNKVTYEKYHSEGSNLPKSDKDMYDFKNVLNKLDKLKKENLN